MLGGKQPFTEEQEARLREIVREEMNAPRADVRDTTSLLSRLAVGGAVFAPSLEAGECDG